MTNERTETADSPRTGGAAQTARTGGAQPLTAPTTIRWDDTNLKSSYANVCNVSSTREEVVLVFGINQAWERGQAEVQVQLTDRLILSPFAAKRLAALLSNVVREYESRFGVLSLDTRRGGDSPSSGA
ncbi:MAG TPA: DUF3467 domain-containing protein [Methylomirabilota bacterium]|jgi:hypothetical protein|nr:DUF3467 domain-containing protein [Methylomirabilota bacterium]